MPSYAASPCDHVEVDEIWTFVEKKQGRLTPEEKAERFDIGDVYLWTCLGPGHQAGAPASLSASGRPTTPAS